ncbi:hypothetical protein TOPH_03788 [Tolypocladium ophioglossoides CBS 100239]|uniref:Uncharacterized protein n=1 Tax=Tolypocladium ophioglossoides (strain CBS 100239) TaxID=1163406 RepID=A0A0L0NC79_TOLOC|nr:hypothetical protein TOPH_03788 [Tolypocladium ophioglossoides CBS 100239]
MVDEALEELGGAGTILAYRIHNEVYLLLFVPSAVSLGINCHGSVSAISTTPLQVVKDQVGVIIAQGGRDRRFNSGLKTAPRAQARTPRSSCDRSSTPAATSAEVIPRSLVTTSPWASSPSITLASLAVRATATAKLYANSASSSPTSCFVGRCGRLIKGSLGSLWNVAFSSEPQLDRLHDGNLTRTDSWMLDDVRFAMFLRPHLTAFRAARDCKDSSNPNMA